MFLRRRLPLHLTTSLRSLFGLIVQTSPILKEPPADICRGIGRIMANYAVLRENAGDRACRRADRLRERLGWEPGILNGGGLKPKWMRWRTFERLSAKHDQLVGRSMQAMML